MSYFGAITQNVKADAGDTASATIIYE